MDDQLAEKIIYMIKTLWNRSSTGSQKLKNAAIISWAQQPQHRKVAIKSALPNISFHKNSNRRKFPYDHTKRDESRAASTTSPRIRAWVASQGKKLLLLLETSLGKALLHDPPQFAEKKNK